jgi:hypothetical protein
MTLLCNLAPPSTPICNCLSACPLGPPHIFIAHCCLRQLLSVPTCLSILIKPDNCKHGSVEGRDQAAPGQISASVPSIRCRKGTYTWVAREISPDACAPGTGVAGGAGGKSSEGGYPSNSEGVHVGQRQGRTITPGVHDRLDLIQSLQARYGV